MTSEEVDIRRLVTHPLNPNRMGSRDFAKLKANLADSGNYPALIVRDLANSKKYGPGMRDYRPDQLQILDGAHRYKILLSFGAHSARVEHWGSLSDEEAWRLLVTLNRLRGKDDPKRRAGLLALLQDTFEQPDRLAEFVPEEPKEISQKIAFYLNPAPPSEPEELDSISRQFDSWFVLVPSQMERVLNAAVKLRLSKGNLPGRDIDPREYVSVHSSYQRGRALFDICSDYVLKETKAQ